MDPVLGVLIGQVWDGDLRFVSLTCTPDASEAETVCGPTDLSVVYTWVKESARPELVEKKVCSIKRSRRKCKPGV